MKQEIVDMEQSPFNKRVFIKLACGHSTTRQRRPTVTALECRECDNEEMIKYAAAVSGKDEEKEKERLARDLAEELANQPDTDVIIIKVAGGRQDHLFDSIDLGWDEYWPAESLEASGLER